MPKRSPMSLRLPKERDGRLAAVARLFGTTAPRLADGLGRSMFAKLLARLKFGCRCPNEDRFWGTNDARGPPPENAACGLPCPELPCPGLPGPALPRATLPPLNDGV